MSVSGFTIGVASGYRWLDNLADPDFFERGLGPHFEGEENLAHISLGEFQSALADYRRKETDPEKIEWARRLVAEIEAYWTERELGPDDSLTIQYH